MRSIQRRTSEGRCAAAPCSTQTSELRSRSSMPGTSAMRWSIVGVAVNVVTRWRSIRSTIRAASNFSSSTSRSPASRLGSVENPLVW